MDFDFVFFFLLQWKSSESEFSDTEESNELEATLSPDFYVMDNEDGAGKQKATRVFKKSSPNGKITVYIGKRDFVDHITSVDPIGGFILNSSLFSFFVL